MQIKRENIMISYRQADYLGAKIALLENNKVVYAVLCSGSIYRITTLMPTSFTTYIEEVIINQTPNHFIIGDIV